ncbi:phosphatidylinositol/phosphatidylcholine transfer protein SFH9 isoform X1 [Punica granatum]|uniref:Phosphatidylinositol/phosphatidylcholine transfer protein SFH9 isoform X1 n=1 Tax=Punica granatum TaxID=22663 RepID=A0A6P8E7Y8_PUNGR|nr:phosphatidylinositol/phosphatidylcholine transfer protein SFH9 isoform X1 [Punica granatum]
MGSVANEESAIKQFQSLMEEVDEPLKTAYETVHQGYPRETLVRFLKARDWNVAIAHKMLIDSLEWRMQNDINSILTKPIVPADLYRAVRDTQLVGLSGFTREGHPVIAIGLGLSTYDKASVNYYVQSHIQMNEYRDRVVLPYATKKYGRYIGTCVKVLDMTGLKLSALNQLKLLTVISTIDDLNYPEKTETYYIVNPPRIFSACWKVSTYLGSFLFSSIRYLNHKTVKFLEWLQVVKPLLQERTRRKIQVLHGCPKDELFKIMDYSSLPHFCRGEGSGSSSGSDNGTVDDCFSLDHTFHQQLYNYIKQQALLMDSSPVKQGSVHVTFLEPEPDDAEIAQTIESEIHKLGENKRGLVSMMSGLKVNGSWKGWF